MKVLCAVEVIKNTDSRGVDVLEKIADILDWGQRLFFIIPIILLVIIFIAIHRWSRQQRNRLFIKTISPIYV